MSKKVLKNYKKVVKCFFAFPSAPDDRKQIIEKAIEIVNASKNPKINFIITSWIKMKGKSSNLISTILESIYEAEIVIADISDLNMNVLFELGFAFGASKKLILFTQGNSAESREKDLSDIEIIRAFKIGKYEDPNILARDLISLLIEKNTSEAEFSKYNNLNISEDDANSILYLKGITKYSYASKMANLIKDNYEEVIIDDWSEYQSQTLNFYITSILKSNLICALFVQKSWDYSRKVNARFSFICGLALAMNKKVLMIGLPGFELPFDYCELLITPQNELIIETKFIEIIANTKPTIEFLLPSYKIDRINYNSYVPTFSKLKDEKPTLKETITAQDKELVILQINIGNISLGNALAENEEKILPEYFIETGQYKRAIANNQALIVGNKGSGKTAIFYQIRNIISSDNAQNLICEIKPSDYKMERFLDILKKLESQKGFQSHVLESVWKTIVYCNLLETIYNDIGTISYREYSLQESSLLSFVEKHLELIISPFDKKLELACDMLEEVANNPHNFSDKIHKEFLNEAKNVLSPILKTKNKILILIDNLDKAWEANSDLSLQALMVFNLMGIHRRLQNEFKIDDISVLIFLRRNIYEFMLLDDKTREADKLMSETIELLWDNKDMLFRILEQRFKIALLKLGKSSDQSLEIFFKLTNINSLKDWLYENIIPRPRDLISFMEKAIDKAVNNNHCEIYEEDLVNALEDYSISSLAQIISEYKAEYGWIESLIFSFTGGKSIFSYKELSKKIKRQFGKINDEETRSKILVLVNMNFVGVTVNNSPIIYAYKISDFKKLKLVIMGKNIDNIFYYINPIFYKCLSIPEQIKIKPRKLFTSIFKH
jgi:hypothetical protein